MEKAGNKKLLHNRKWTAEVFENILENAIKYSDENTQIKIAVNPMEMYTAVSFSDQGIGIASSEFQDIFRRFYRSPMVRDREGAGIGLCLSKMILEKEKGYLTVESKLGKGSCFTVYLQNGTITKL